MKPRVIMLLIIIITCFTTSCKVNDGNMTNEPQARMTMPSEHNTLSTHHNVFIWDETIEFKEAALTIDIHAEIVDPDSRYIDVYTVVPREITQQMADEFLQVACNSDKLLSTTPKLTKEEINEEIRLIRESITDQSSDFNMAGLDSKDYERILNEKNSEIRFLESMLETAPEQHTAIEISTAFQLYNSGQTNYYLIEGYPINGRSASSYINICKSEAPFYMQEIFLFNPAKAGYPPDQISRNTSKLKGLSLSLEQAKNHADELLRHLGEEEYDVFLCASASIYTHNDETVADANKCYVLYYTKVVGELPIVLKLNEYNLSPEIISNSWPSEYIMVCVTDDGVVFFDLISPQMEIEIFDSVNIASIDELMAAFRMIADENINYVKESQDIKSREIIIDRIELCYVRTKSYDKDGLALLVPCWCFYGYEIDQFYEGKTRGHNVDSENKQLHQAVGHCFLTINAITKEPIDLLEVYK